MLKLKGVYIKFGPWHIFPIGMKGAQFLLKKITQFYTNTFELLSHRLPREAQPIHLYNSWSGV